MPPSFLHHHMVGLSLETEKRRKLEVKNTMERNKNEKHPGCQPGHSGGFSTSHPASTTGTPVVVLPAARAHRPIIAQPGKPLDGLLPWRSALGGVCRS